MQSSSASKPTIEVKSGGNENKVSENKEYMNVFENLKSQSPQNEFENMFNVDLQEQLVNSSLQHFDRPTPPDKLAPSQN